MVYKIVRSREQIIFCKRPTRRAEDRVLDPAAARGEESTAFAASSGDQIY
jgi:hypothetical protein